MGDGAEVLADAFRISSFAVVLRSLNSMSISGPDMDALVISMADYVRRSADYSPRMMREDGDVCRFLSELARYAKDNRHFDLEGILADFNIPALCKRAPRRERDSLRR